MAGSIDDTRPSPDALLKAAEKEARGLASVEPDAVPLLEPLVEITTTGRTVADRILADFSRTRGDIPQMIAALAMT